MKVDLIIQARIGSKRLPGKSLLPLAGEPLIGRIIERVQRCKNLSEIIVAIPDTHENLELKKYLEKKGINTAIHYPIPIHKQLAYTEKYGPSREKYENCERQSEKILSLPIHQYLTENDIKFICNEVLLFYHGKKST